MKLDEALRHLTEDEISIQGLNGAITNARSTKNGTAVTFVTDAITPGDLVRGWNKVAIIVYVDRSAWERVTSPEIEAKS